MSHSSSEVSVDLMNNNSAMELLKCIKLIPVRTLTFLFKKVPEVITQLILLVGKPNFQTNALMFHNLHFLNKHQMASKLKLQL